MAGSSQGNRIASDEDDEDEEDGEDWEGIWSKSFKESGEI